MPYAPIRAPTYNRLLDDLTADGAIRGIERTIAKLVQLGVTPPAGSRLHQAKVEADWEKGSVEALVEEVLDEETGDDEEESD